MEIPLEQEENHQKHPDSPSPSMERFYGQERSRHGCDTVVGAWTWNPLDWVPCMAPLLSKGSRVSQPPAQVSGLAVEHPSFWRWGSDVTRWPVERQGLCEEHGLPFPTASSSRSLCPPLSSCLIRISTFKDQTNSHSSMMSPSSRGPWGHPSRHCA